MSVTEWIVSLMVIVGAMFSVIAGLGIIRLPDVYSRTHATSASSVFGVLFITVATFIYFAVYHNQWVLKFLLAFVFILISTPIATLIISRSAYRTGVPMDSSYVVDDLAEYYKELEKEQILSEEENN